MRRIIGVPAELSDKGLPLFFRGWEWVDDPGDEVVIDFSRVSFSAPWAITLFAAYALWLKEVHGRNVDVWIDETSEAGRFLARLGLRGLLGKDDGSARPALPGRFAHSRESRPATPFPSMSTRS